MSSKSRKNETKFIITYNHNGIYKYYNETMTLLECYKELNNNDLINGDILLIRYHCKWCEYSPNWMRNLYVKYTLIRHTMPKEHKY